MNYLSSTAPVLLVVLLAPAASGAAAQEARSPVTEARGTLTAVWENDVFSTTDRNYTNGVRLSYLSPARSPGPVMGFLDRLVADEATPTFHRRGLALGHSLYTPRNTLTDEPLPDQHPYAAHLYADYTAIVEQPATVDQLTLSVGIVGPSAGGDWIQNEMHDIFGDAAVYGWENQIRDTAAVDVAFDRMYPEFAAGEVGPLSVDLVPNWGVTAGTVNVNARAGLTVRVGNDLSTDLGAPTIRPSLPASTSFTPNGGIDWYLFAGVNGRAVAHNLFLDGSYFREDDPQVPSRTFVGDVQAGAVVELGRARLTATFVHRTEAFKGQAQPQKFGAVSLGWKY